jgi:hypothetical protein
MSRERFVVLGLAHVRAGWFSELSHWSTSGMWPVEFIRCVSVDEVRSRLNGPRAVSALMLDGRRSGVDRDLLAQARDVGAAAIIIGDDRRDWVSLGAVGQLPATFSRDELVEILERHATPIRHGDRVDPTDASVVDGEWRGALIAVTGSPGAGASTVAMALAQALGSDARNSGLVLLADLALDADLAMYHDARDVVPGVQELVEAFHGGTIAGEQLRSLTFAVADRGYHLLLGLRNHRDWTAVRPRAFEAALDATRRTFRYVIADIDSDVEGQERTGSVDVEERNTFARTCARQADLVLVVGNPGTKGMAALVRCVHRLLEHGVDPPRVLGVINRVGRTPRQRAQHTKAFVELTSGATRLPPPLFIGDRRGLGAFIDQAAPLPRNMTRTLGRTVTVLLARDELAEPPASAMQPLRVSPGSLGSWADEEALG